MFRYAIAAYLLLLSLMGPNPCCCTLARLATLATAPPRADERQETQRPACCQRRLASESADRRNATQSRGRSPVSKGPIERCQCETSLCHAAPLPSTDFAVAMKRAGLDDLTLNHAAPLMLEAGDDFAMLKYPDGISHAARSGREIRVAFHSWLC